MRKIKKGTSRLLALLLSIMMIAGMLPMSALAQTSKNIADSAAQMEITDDDLAANDYETYYYSEEITYTYKGEKVSFISESQIQADGKTYNLKNKKTEVAVNAAEDETVTINLTDLSVPVGQIPGEWNVYFGGTVQMVYQTDIPGMDEVRSAESTNAPTTLTLSNISAGTYHLTGGTIYEKANEWSPGHDFGNGTVTEACFGTLPDITVTVGGSASDEYLGVKTEARVYEDFQNDIWLQYQQKDMQVGDTTNLRPWRVEQIVSDVINNDVARPNFHFEIIAGDSISLDTTESKEKAVVTAKKAGTSIVKVTYDALEYKGKIWGAISPVNTAYAIFTVGETGTATITTNEDLAKWRHYDTIYYKDGKTTPYTFTVDTENAQSVRVTVNGLEVQGNENQYTANLENRSNIIGIEARDAEGNVKSMYRVIDARFIEVNVANKTNPDQSLKAGDTANISFRGITMPVYKLATIYNPQFGKNATRVTYATDLLGSFEGKCGQWDLATDNDFDVTFTEAGSYTFHSDNGIHCAWWGSELGADITANGSGEPNLNAPTLMDNFSVLPDFTVTVEGKTAVESIALNKTELTMKLGQNEQLTAIVLPDSTTHKEVTWESSDTSVVTVTADGTVTAVKAGKADITAMADGKTAVCKVTVAASTVEEVNAAIADIPAADNLTLRDKAAVDTARMLYDNLSDVDKDKVADYTRLTDAENKMTELLAIPFIFSLNGTPLKMIQEEEHTSIRGHYYKVEVPKGTKTVQLERYKDIKVQDQSYGELISAGTNTVDIKNIGYGKGSYFIINYDWYYYDYIYFVEVDESVSVTRVTLNKTELTLNPGQSEALTATVLPDNATHKEVTWKSSDTSVVTVAADGTITAVKAGTADITATADGKTAMCKVTVQDEEPLESGYVTVSIERFTIGQGFYREPIKVKFEAGQTAMDIIKSLVGDNLITNIDATYISGIKGADLGKDQVVVPSYITEKLGGPTTDEARETGNSDDDVLEEFDYNYGSGWYYFANNEAPNVGLADWTLTNGDVIRLQFTLLYGEDLTGTFFGEGEPVIAISDKDAAIALLAEINGREDKTDLLKNPAVKTAYDALQTIVQNAVAPQEDVNAAVRALEDAVGEFSDLQQAKADAKAQLDSYKNADDYRDAQKTELASAIAAGKNAIDRAADAQAVKAALATAKTQMDAIKTDAQLTAEEAASLASIKASAKSELDSYKNADDYREAQKTELASAIAAGKNAIDQAADAQAVKAALAAAKAQMDAVKTNAQLTAEDQAAIMAELQKHLSVLLQKVPNPAVGSIGGEWSVLALARAGYKVPGDYFDNYYAKAVQYIKENINDKGQLHSVKSTENSRLILALTAIGKDVTDVAGHNLLTGLSDLAYLKKQGINGPVWALIALDSHDYVIPALKGEGTQATRENILAYILDKQLEDGGWTLSGKKADPDMTGMALQALAPYYGTNVNVKAAVDKALECLSDIQLANGGFFSWGEGENAESCAQVIAALTALGIDPTTDARFVKANGNPVSALLTFALKDGGFKHIHSESELNGMATEQGSYALVAYARYLNKQTSLYDMSDVTIGGNSDQPEPEDKNITLTDIEGTGITATGKESILNGLELEANLLVSGDKYDKVKEALKDGKFTLYDLYLLENNLEIQPDGTITITFPVPDGYDGAKCKVYHINEDGSVVEVQSVLKDGKLVLETDEMGTYAIWQPVSVDNNQGDNNQNTADNPQTGDTGSPYAMAAVMILSLEAILVFSRKKRQSF